MIFEPHSDKQERVVFSDRRITVAATGIQWGKGLLVNNLVLTPSGYRKVSSIRVGEYLIDRDGLPTEVTGVFPQGQRPCFRLHFTDGKSLECDDQHLHVIHRRSGRREHIMTTTELYSSTWLWGKAQVPSVKPIELPEQDQPIPPYSMGVLLGDGGMSGKSLKFSNGDARLIERVTEELSCEAIRIVSQGQYSYGVSSNERCENGYSRNKIMKQLQRLGLWGKRSWEKFIPDIYKYGSIGQRLDVLRGLMDTDGTAEKNRKLEFYSTSLQLARDVVWLVESLGGKAWISEKQGSYRKNGERTVTRMCFRVAIISPFFNVFWLDRKAERYFVHENTANKVLKSVEPIGMHETICFSVASESRTFVANDQIVTHNSESGAVRMVKTIYEYTDPRDTFIIAAPTFPIMEQATLPTFLEFVEPLSIGTYLKGDRVFETKWGSIVYFRTGTNPDSVVGIRRCRGIWGDEAGLFSLYFWENLQGRAAPKMCPIWLTTSPYSLNWIYKELIKPAQAGTRDDVELVQARSDENPFFPKEEYERRKKTMDPRRFRMMFGGNWERPEGMVYDCWSEEHNTVDLDEVPVSRLRVFGGIDWGYTEPFVLIIGGWDAVERKMYILSVFKKSRMTLTAIKDLLLDRHRIWKFEMVACGHDQPGYIDELCMAKIPAIKAVNDVALGISRVYELMAQRQLKLVKGKCNHLIDELEAYHYPEPKETKPDQPQLDQKPVQVDDHACDSIRYLVATSWDLFQDRRGVKIPHSEGRPGESHYNRIQRLLRGQSRVA